MFARAAGAARFDGIDDLAPHPGWHLTAAIGLAAVIVAAMVLVRNRVIRRRLLVSSIAFLAAVGVHATLGANGAADPDVAAIGEHVEALLFAFVAVTLIVTLTLNPWFREGSLDRAPSIIQDAIVMVVFGSMALYLFRADAKLLAGSAIAAAAVGLALQDTLANLFSGLGIQIDRPFRVGHWIALSTYEGIVVEVTWRSTKIRTKLGNLVVLPNSVVAKEPITNFSEPVLPTMLMVDVGVSYAVPPNAVRHTILAAIRDVSRVLEVPAPDVLLYTFGDSSIGYRARFWTNDFGGDETIKDDVRRAIYYELRRRGMEIPSPIRTIYTRAEPPPESPERRTVLARTIATVPVLASLDADVHRALAMAANEPLYGDGEIIVREGDAGTSMFIVERGRVVVTVGPDQKEVATIDPGGIFGEMSLLTGEPRSATVVARGDAHLLEISADMFRTYVRSHPEVVEPLAAAAEARRAELARTRATSTVPHAHETASVAARIREFFGLR